MSIQMKGDRPGRDRTPIAHRFIGGERDMRTIPSRRDVRRALSQERTSLRDENTRGFVSPGINSWASGVLSLPGRTALASERFTGIIKEPNNFLRLLGRVGMDSRLRRLFNGVIYLTLVRHGLLRPHCPLDTSYSLLSSSRLLSVSPISLT